MALHAPAALLFFNFPSRPGIFILTSTLPPEEQKKKNPDISDISYVRDGPGNGTADPCVY
jgi:hypothetical protein